MIKRLSASGKSWSDSVDGGTKRAVGSIRSKMPNSVIGKVIKVLMNINEMSIALYPKSFLLIAKSIPNDCQKYSETSLAADNIHSFIRCVLYSWIIKIRSTALPWQAMNLIFFHPRAVGRRECTLTLVAKNFLQGQLSVVCCPAGWIESFQPMLYAIFNTVDWYRSRRHCVYAFWRCSMYLRACQDSWIMNALPVFRGPTRRSFRVCVGTSQQ